MQRLRTLTRQQATQFIEDGWIRLDDCFSRATAEEWTNGALERSKIDRRDPSTWHSHLAFLGQVGGVQRQADVRKFAPKAWGAVCDLLGGASRIDQPWVQTDGFVVNFPTDPAQPRWIPNEVQGNWHVDGDFNHFLDSPELALLTVWLFSDVAPDGGATYIAPDSVGVVARQLRNNPRGLSAKALRLDMRLHHECRKFMPLAGPVGTVYLMHPFMLHSTSQNLTKNIRLIRNGGPRLKAPMRLDRADPGDYSLVERATLHGLGVERLAFTPPPNQWRHPTDHDTGAKLPPRKHASPSERRAALTG